MAAPCGRRKGTYTRPLWLKIGYAFKASRFNMSTSVEAFAFATQSAPDGTGFADGVVATLAIHQLGAHFDVGFTHLGGTAEE